MAEVHKAVAGEDEDDSLDVRDYYEVDKDSCSKEEVAQVFPVTYQVRRKTILSDSFQDSNCCIQLVADTSEQQLAAANKKHEVIVINVKTGEKTETYSAHEKDITGMKFSKLNNNMVFSCSLDGTIKMWDIRSNKCECVFEQKGGEHIAREYSCLDVNCSGEFLCGGTTVAGDGSAYLMFWDTRNTKNLLGGYFDTHSDDITQVRFHPSKREQLASAGMDNLINIFDISKKDESDAFSYCINLETTPDAVHWDFAENCQSKIFAVNYPQTVQYWDIEDTVATFEITGDKMCKAILRQQPSQCHLVSLNFDAALNPLLMVSSNLGCDSVQDVCIRTLQYNREKKKLVPHSVLELESNKTLHMFDSVYLASSDVFVTVEPNGLRYWGTKGHKRANDVVHGLNKKLKQM